MAEEVVFRDVMKAAYDYAATAEDELTMKEDQLLYLLGNLDDDWAKVQVHIPLDALSEAEPAAGLVPSAYIEPAPPLYRAFAVYDYEPNGEGEILMKENEKMSVYLKEDEWILVKIDRKGTVSQPAIGYVPANYVEEGEGDGEAPAQEEAPAAQAAVPVPVAVPQTPATPTSQVNPAERAAAAAAKLKGDPVDIWNVSEIDKKGKKKKGTLGVGNGSIFFASEADKAPVQQWQVSMVTSVSVNEDKHKHVNLEISSPNGDVSLEFGAGSRDEANAIVEKVERSKRLAIGESSSSPPPKSPEPAANTSSSGIKSPIPSAPNGGRLLPPPAHPGLSPSPSGKSKGVRWDTAPPAEIPQAVQSDEESEGHTAAAGPPSAGKTVAIAMYDFEADGDDELTVKEGEKLTVLDKEESEEWWKCRNSNGKEGVVPASYLEIESADEADDNAAAEAAAEAARAEAARKEQEQAAAAAAKAKRLADESRRKREQEAREAQERQEREEREEAEAREAEAQRQKEERDRRAREARRRETEVPAQTSSKSSTNGTPKNSHNRGQSKDLPGRPNLEKPKPTNTRIWHDRSGQFKVEAQFLGVHNNKIRLHKANGVIIEVPEEKMSAEDMDYIRKSGRKPTSPTSPSGNDDDVPLGALAKSRPTSTQGPSSSRPQAPLRKSHIDWFEFFLNSGCDIDDCTRYATSFEREKIDEAILPDLTHDTLRGLGLREGDVIRVMKQIEQRGWKVAPPRSADPKVQEQMKKDAELAARLQEEEYGRKTPVRNNTASPGLFTAGPGGALKNNTRRGRPPPTKAATLTVDASGIASASEQLSRTSTPANVSSPTTATASTSKPATSPPPVSGFEDDAWTPRPASAASKPAPTPISATTSAPAPVATPTPPPPPPAPPVQPAVPQPPAQPATQPPAPQPIAAPKLASEFDVLAKIGTMRPPSAPAPPATAPLPTTISPPPAGFQQGMGMGSSTAPMGSLLQAQATGALSPLQAAGGPRAPFAPVPQNEGLLKPLIPTTTGFNSFVPTRPGTAPATSLPTAGATPSFLTAQPTGFNPSFNQVNQAPQPSISPLLTNPTGFSPSPNPLFQPPSATSSGFSTSSYLSANSTFQTPSPIVTQPTGFGNPGAGSGFGTQFGGANPGSSFLNAISSQPTGMFTGPPNVNPPPDNNSPANVFAAMKAGSFANNAAPQSSDRYDALRPQPTGWNALSSGVQPQPTGFNPGFGAGLQPGSNFGQPAGFQQPMQTGFGQPGFGAPQNQFGGFQR